MGNKEVHIQYNFPAQLISRVDCARCHIPTACRAPSALYLALPTSVTPSFALKSALTASKHERPSAQAPTTSTQSNPFAEPSKALISFSVRCAAVRRN